MNTDLENLLRDGMERFTADLRAPAGLAGRAARRRRRRLAVQVASAAGAALAAGAVALVAVVLPETGNGVDTTAYVVKHVSKALNAAQPGEIAHLTVTGSTTTSAGTTTTTTAHEWSYGSQWRSVTTSAAGSPIFDEGSDAGRFTLVSYLTGTWARQRGLDSPAVPEPVSRDCEPAAGPAADKLLFQPGLSGTGFAARSLPVAAALRLAISCEALALGGRQRVDGLEAVKLSSLPGSKVAEVIWISLGTDLPVRLVIRSVAGSPVRWQTADITWLQPTAQNLANLTVPIPAGFRKVPLADLIMKFAMLMPGGLGPDAGSYHG